jgi:hypothetical protein
MEVNMKNFSSVSVFLLALLTSMAIGCGMSYVADELRGTAKPEGGTIEVIPQTKTFQASQEKLWNASKQALDEMGYVYEANPASKMIKTEAKQLGDTEKSLGAGAKYFAKLYVTVESPSVSFRARFDKRSNVTMGGDSLEYPEKENELRKTFFNLIDRNIGR